MRRRASKARTKGEREAARERRWRATVRRIASFARGESFPVAKRIESAHLLATIIKRERIPASARLDAFEVLAELAEITPRPGRFADCFKIPDRAVQ